MHDLYCTRCDWEAVVEDYAHIDTLPPACPECGGLVRPDVVLFGEMLRGAKVRALEAELRAGFDLVFSIGTTSVFPYIAQPVRMARSQGRPVIEINPGQTEVSSLVTHKIAGGAAESLHAIALALGS